MSRKSRYREERLSPEVRRSLVYVCAALAVIGVKLYMNEIDPVPVLHEKYIAVSTCLEGSEFDVNPDTLQETVLYPGTSGIVIDSPDSDSELVFIVKRSNIFKTPDVLPNEPTARTMARDYGCDIEDTSQVG